MNTKQCIENRLNDTFHPTILTVTDESYLHVGHPGAAKGGGHYRIKIQAQQLAGMTRINQHRLINECLKDLFKIKIHALAIEIIAIK